MKFINYLLILFLILTSNLISQSVSKNDTIKYNIENCINQFNLEKVEKTKAGYQYWFADKNFAEGKTIKLSVVAPNSATHPPHSHTEDEFFFILEGNAEFYLDGNVKEVGPMTSLYCPSYIEHGIKNIGDKELKYLVIKKYEK